MASQTLSKYVAQVGIASSPNVQIVGSVLQALVQNAKVEELRPLLRKYGLETIELDKWYPQQLVLDFHMAVANSEVNAGENLVAIGMKAVDTMPFPETAKTIEDGVNVVDAMTRQIYRNLPDGEGLSIAARRPGYLLVIDNTPYPEDIIYGYLWALAKRFRPSGADFKVRVVENTDPETYPGKAFEITWKDA